MKSNKVSLIFTLLLIFSELIPSDYFFVIISFFYIVIVVFRELCKIRIGFIEKCLLIVVLNGCIIGGVFLFFERYDFRDYVRDLYYCLFPLLVICFLRIIPEKYIKNYEESFVLASIVISAIHLAKLGNKNCKGNEGI